MSRKYLPHKLSFGELEIKLQLIADPEKLFEELLEKSLDDPDIYDERIPYWAELWPSAIGLSQYLSDNSKIVKGKRVLEIGCGLGLPGIVAQKLGADVILTDYLSEAIDYAKRNWKLNFKTDPNTALLDWRSSVNFKKADVLLASDIAYETKSFIPVFKAIQQLVNPGGVILISEPNRKFAKTFFDQIRKKVKSISGESFDIERGGINYVITVHKIEL